MPSSGIFRLFGVVRGFFDPIIILSEKSQNKNAATLKVLKNKHSLYKWALLKFFSFHLDSIVIFCCTNLMLILALDLKKGGMSWKLSAVNAEGR
jgi:hypothetical protein